MNQESVNIIPIIPLSIDDIDFEAIDCIPCGPDINLVEDLELDRDVTEIIGSNSKITFFTVSDDLHPYVVFQLKNIDRFITIRLLTIDTENNEKIIEMTTKTSSVIIENADYCKIPLVIGEGWQRLCINLSDILKTAFNVKYRNCQEVTVYGSCRIACIFFQSKDYADPQLPKFLRVTNPYLTSS